MKLLRKSFVISMGFDGSFFLDIVEIILEKINTRRINSAILFGALEFVQTIISQFVIFFMTEILMVWQPSQHLNGVQGGSRPESHKSLRWISTVGDPWISSRLWPMSFVATSSQ